jgi:hypothetical protein
VSTEPAATPGTPPAPGDQPNWAAFNRLAVVAAVVGWVLYVLAGIANLGTAETPQDKAAATGRFMVGYLSGFVFWASLPLGAMALLMIRYLTKTSWGLLLTRPFEAATRTLPLTVRSSWRCTRGTCRRTGGRPRRRPKRPTPVRPRRARPRSATW